jgi:TolB-like protein/Tfp pilus assembly protein PilF
VVQRNAASNLRCGQPGVRIQHRVSTVGAGEKEWDMKDPSPVSTPGLTDQPPEAPLDSWKEIARYVKRDVSTVQRWEKREGMPIHRHVHDKRGSVYAFSSELDVWLQSRRLRLEEEEKEHEGSGEIPVDAEGDHRPRGTSRARPWLVLGGVAVLGLLAVTQVMTRSHARDATRPKITSLAVLPLENLSDDPTQEYLADGMTEALITNLAKIGALRVISRTSVMQYKGAKKPLPQIARELNVDAVIEGSVQRWGNRVRVSARLIQVASDRHMWAESYERDLRDVLALQSELARTIASEIRIKVTPQEQARLANVQPVDPASHDAYVKGLYYFNDGRGHAATKRGEESFQKSVEYLRQAVQIDPNYAMAYAQLARTYYWMAATGMQGELVAESTVAARKALELDPTLAEAHGALAYVMFRFDWDWAGAEREFRRAIELNPGYVEAYHGYAFYLAVMGRFDEAIAEKDKALLLDPFPLPQTIYTAYIYGCAHQYDRAIEQLRTLLALDPKNRLGHYELGEFYIRKGMYDQAMEEIQAAQATAKVTGRRVASLQLVLAFANAAAGRRSEARRLLYQFTGRPKEVAGWEVNIAEIYALLGDKTNAIAWLEKAAQQDPYEFAYVRCLEPFDSLRADPRVQEMFRRLGLPP